MFAFTFCTPTLAIIPVAYGLVVLGPKYTLSYRIQSPLSHELTLLPPTSFSTMTPFIPEYRSAGIQLYAFHSAGVLVGVGCIMSTLAVLDAIPPAPTHVSVTVVVDESSGLVEPILEIPDQLNGITVQLFAFVEFHATVTELVPVSVATLLPFTVTLAVGCGGGGVTIVGEYLIVTVLVTEPPDPVHVSETVVVAERNGVDEPAFDVPLHPNGVREQLVAFVDDHAITTELVVAIVTELVPFTVSVAVGTGGGGGVDVDVVGMEFVTIRLATL